MYRQILSVLTGLLWLGTGTLPATAAPKDILRKENTKELAVVAEVAPAAEGYPYRLVLNTGVVETVNFEELHSRQYLYYLNDYFEHEANKKEESLRVSLWLKGFNFGTQQTKREKAMRLCGFLVRPEVGKFYRGSFDETAYGEQFALDFFEDLCEQPLAQIEAFEDCQARLSRSYLRFSVYGGSVRAACDLELETR